MEEFPGQRHDNSSVYIYEGERWHLDSRYKDTPYKYYRCARRSGKNCSAQVYQDEEGVYKRYGYHNHGHDGKALEECRFKEYIRVIAQDITIEPDEVVRRASVRYPATGEICKPGALKSFIKRVRAELLPPIPATVRALGLLLEEYEPMTPIYRGTVSAGGSSALIFASTEMLEFLRTARYLHIDGTFKGYAAVFVLCEKRPKSLYDAIWTKIIELVPELRDNLRAVWTDFEAGAIASLRTNFPQIRIRGCWFHFCRATYRKWKSLKMPNPPRNILHLSWGLPLLPPDRFAEGCLEIMNRADPLAEGPLRKLNDFGQYLRRWIRLVDVVSLYEEPIRTNNIAEAFNRQATRKLGGTHPKLWVFLNKLKETIDDETMKLRRQIEHGGIAASPQTRDWLRIDENIATCQRRLATGRYDVRDFLNAVTNRDQRLAMDDEIEHNPADNEVDCAMPAAADIQDPADVFEDNPVHAEQPRRRGPRPGRRIVAVGAENEESDNDDGGVDHEMAAAANMQGPANVFEDVPVHDQEPRARGPAAVLRPEQRFTAGVAESEESNNDDDSETDVNNRGRRARDQVEEHHRLFRSRINTVNIAGPSRTRTPTTTDESDDDDSEPHVRNRGHGARVQAKGYHHLSRRRVGAVDTPLVISDDSEDDVPPPIVSTRQGRTTGLAPFNEPVARASQPRPTARASSPRITAPVSRAQPPARASPPRPRARASPPRPTARASSPRTTPPTSRVQPVARAFLPQPTAHASPPRHTAPVSRAQPVARTSPPRPTARASSPRTTAPTSRSQPVARAFLPQPTARASPPRHTAPVSRAQPVARASPTRPRACASPPRPTTPVSPAQPVARAFWPRLVAPELVARTVTLAPSGPSTGQTASTPSLHVATMANGTQGPSRNRKRGHSQPPHPPPPPASEKNKKRNKRRKEMKRIAAEKQRDNAAKAEEALRLHSELAAVRRQLEAAQRQLDEIGDNGLCRICYAQPATHAFLPCGHRICCFTCGDRIWKDPRRECACCRTKLTEPPRKIIV